MAETNTVDTMDGLHKEVYGDGPLNVIPETDILQRKVPFSEGTMLGDVFVEQVILADEGGITEAAPGDGGFKLLSAVAMTSKKAKFDGRQILIRGNADYEVMSKATAAGAKAFKSASQTLVDSLNASIRHRIEWNSFYGQKEVARADSSVNATATTTTVTFHDEHWADQAFTGKEGHKVAFYDSAGTNLVSSGADAIFTITSVDNDNFKMVITGTATGITALDSDLGSADQYMYWLGSVGVDQTNGYPPSTLASKSMYGLHDLITNTGTRFEIAANTYSLWKGNTKDCGSGPLTLQKILSGLGIAQARGGLASPVSVFCNPVTWNNVASDQAALRRFGGERGRDAENGFEFIKFYSASGPVELIGHGMVKRSHAFAVPIKKVKRVGSADVTFKTPGMGDKMWIHLPDNAAAQLRAYSNQQIFIENPAQCVFFENIVNA